MLRELIKKYYSSKFSKDTLWLLAAQITLMTSAFGINLIIGIKQGANNLGVFNQTLAFYSIISTFIALGLNNTLIKKISEITHNIKLEKHILTSTLAITTLFSLLTVGIIIGITIFYPSLYSSKELAHAIIIALFALPLFNLNKNFMAYFTGQRNQKMNSINKIARWALTFIYICIISFKTNDIEPLLYSFFIVELIILIANIIYRIEYFDFSFNFVLVKENIAFGIKSFVAELISVFYDSIDLILIGYFLANSEVGVYSFLIFFAKTLYLFPSIIQQNINPIISNLWYNKQLDLLHSHITKIKKINFVVVSSQLIGILIFYKIVIVFVKQEFSDSYFYFMVAIVGVFIFSLISWCGSMLVMTGKLKENNYRTSTIIVISITLTICLTYQFHLLGACIAVSLNAIISFLITRSFMNKVLSVKII